MSIAITVDSLSKRYRLGQYQAAYGTLRETLVHAGRRMPYPCPPSPRESSSPRAYESSDLALR